MVSILNFQKPDEIITLSEGLSSAVFEFKPLEPGFGLTVGHAVRRVLLSSLEGYSFASFKIEGVLHEFSSVEGVLEDVPSIAMTLKSLRLKPLGKGVSEETVSMKINGKDTPVFTAQHISEHLDHFQVVNLDQVICHLDPSVSISISLSLCKGRGYVASEDLKLENRDVPIGTVFIDSTYTPVQNVKYSVSDYRVGKKTDYEKLTVEITTDGTIDPKSALLQVADILIMHFRLLSDSNRIKETVSVIQEEVFDEKLLVRKHLLKTRLDNLEISVRAKNCLSVAGVETLMDLVRHNVSDLMKFRNFGKKSLDELGDLLEDKGLSFGMDIAPYMSDND